MLTSKDDRQTIQTDPKGRHELTWAFSPDELKRQKLLFFLNLGTAFFKFKKILYLPFEY